MTVTDPSSSGPAPAEPATGPASGGPPTTTRGQRARAVFTSPGWLATIAGCIAFAVVCWSVLAPWQFGRHAERSASNAAITAAVSTAPVPVTELLSPDRDVLPEVAWQPATAAGVFLPEQQVFVRLRQDTAGQPASEVVTPLLLDDGTVLLVNRGYVSVADLAAGTRVEELPAGRVTVTGRVQTLESDPLDRAPVEVDGRTEVHAIDPTVLGPLPGPVLRGYIQLVPDSPGVLRAIGVPQVSLGPFLSYGFQWVAFGAIALIGMIIFVYREIAGPRGSTRRADLSELYDRE